MANVFCFGAEGKVPSLLASVWISVQIGYIFSGLSSDLTGFWSINCDGNNLFVLQTFESWLYLFNSTIQWAICGDPYFVSKTTSIAFYNTLYRQKRQKCSSISKQNYCWHNPDKKKYYIYFIFPSYTAAVPNNAQANHLAKKSPWGSNEIPSDATQFNPVH